MRLLLAKSVMNILFLIVYLKNIFSHFKTRQYFHNYKSTVYKLLYVRLREGYTIRSIDYFELDSQPMIKLSMCLLWKPDTSLEYVISAPWRRSFQKV